MGRFGFLSHYASTKSVQGKFFATADGIYSSDFVIANSKFLVQGSNVWEIWAMKITGAHFVDVYAYEPHGDEAQQRAILVYPSTLAIKDLIRLNIHQLVLLLGSVLADRNGSRLRLAQQVIELSRSQRCCVSLSFMDKNRSGFGVKERHESIYISRTARVMSPYHCFPHSIGRHGQVPRAELQGGRWCSRR